MKVFKFGGASVKDADGVKNVASIIKNCGEKHLVIVISAMGKTTNALEAVLEQSNKNQNFTPKLEEVKNYHQQILNALFEDKNHFIFKELDDLFEELTETLNKYQNKAYDFVYDQIVGFGEIISTKIISAYLSIFGYIHIWKNARDIIFTDNLYREARVDFEKTNRSIEKQFLPELEIQPIVTQGFIGSSENGTYTTLGREGSDYTAAILAAALNATELVIWKDVPGILNADPHRFKNTVKFEFLTYKDAVEMTYYGASVLHPKTIKPVENKNIPLHVRSFLKPTETGTYIIAEVKDKAAKVPVIILKEIQVLISISTQNLSFIAEENIRTIFEEVVRFGIKINVMQNSAISFFISVDDMGEKVQDFVKALNDDFAVTQKSGLQLLTFKNAAEESIQQLLVDKNILLELRTPKTSQFVIEAVF